MRKKKNVLFLLAVILSLTISTIPTYAESVTSVSISFKEEAGTLPPTSGDKVTPIKKGTTTNPNDYISATGSGKRLPATGDQCQKSLILLGYFSLIAFLLCMILGRKRGVYSHESF
ncbi:hypothetical protein ABE869_08365 [Enterococcus gilvus]|uniref:hypothetical protein n=1 Tax=Enterococcus gilvus TaxID=160453 RepID=UPI003D6B84A1